jgi:hypothetical protein
MVYVSPTSLVTQRPLVISGVSIPAGTSLTGAQIAKIPNIDGLVSRGWIKPTPETYARKGKFRGRPTSVRPGLRSHPIA